MVFIWLFVVHVQKHDNTLYFFVSGAKIGHRNSIRTNCSIYLDQVLNLNTNILDCHHNFLGKKLKLNEWVVCNFDAKNWSLGMKEVLDAYL